MDSPGYEQEDYPFKKKNRYRVIKEWYRKGTTFEVGQELEFEHTIYNHYDDAKIYCFKDVKQGFFLRWPCNTHETDQWKEYFELI